MLLVVAQGRGFTRRPARHQRIAALGDLPLDELTKCVLGDTATGKGRYQRRDGAEKHELSSFHGGFTGRWAAFCSGPDKDAKYSMSSMWRAAAILPILVVATTPSSSAQYAAPATPAY